MSQSARRLSGWAAFTLEQQQLQEHASKINGDSFPPILYNNSKTGPSESLLHGKPLARPYSSVLQPCAENGRIPVSGSCVSEETFIAMDNKIDPVNSLKKLHSWADEGLIRDILSAAENDVDQASSLLNTMSFSKSKRSETPFPESSSFVNDQFFQEGFDQGGSLNENNLPLGGTQEKVLDGNVLFVPLEPEWEEDDVYLRHRKEALRMRRYGILL